MTEEEALRDLGTLHERMRLILLGHYYCRTLDINWLMDLTNIIGHCQDRTAVLKEKIEKKEQEVLLLTQITEKAA